MADLSVYQRVTPLNRLQELSQREQFAINQAKEQQRMAKELQLAKIKQMEQDAMTGGNLPATVRIANEIQDALARGDKNRANLLHQVHKTLDKGVLPYWQQQGYNEQPEQQPMSQTTRGMEQGIQDMQQQSMQPMSGVGEIPGYSDLLAGRGAKVKGAEEEAKLRKQLELEPQIKQATSRAEYTEKGFQTLPKIQRSLESQELREEYLTPVFNDIERLADVTGTTGWIGSLAKAIPGTPAYDLRSQAETLLANAGFDRLQEMRDNSPTGGALGQVSERELSLLQSAARNLMQSQSKEQFLTNLMAFKEQRQKSLMNVRRAYEQDYKRFGGARDENLPSPKQQQDVDYTEFFK